ncbi:MAG: MFS transporter [Dehalococcoidia bacterium]|uniref:MFS transporter n=1 Tax=Candidatus Amarobacter glycogenicus TaxID=3140699 RepID=UPI00313760D1|nr:MFS transporter [Dehalococcoidia bacterium]
MNPEAAPVRPVPLLQQRPFRVLNYTRFSSRVAQNAINFALVLLIVEETGKAFLSSLLVLALVVPATAAGIVAGTAADVLPKRLLVSLGDLVRAGICLYFLRNQGGVASYYVVAVLLATATQFASSAEGAILPSIVARHELARANAIAQGVGGAAQLVGLAVLTPVVLRLFDSPRALFAICAGLFTLAAVQVWWIGRTSSSHRQEIGGDVPGSWWLTGWRAMRADPRVMHAAIELTLLSTAIIILSGLIPAYISEILDLPVDIGAVILTPGAIGVVLGLRVAGFLAHRVPHAFLSSVGFFSFVVLLALLAFVNTEADFLGGYAYFSWLNDVQIGKFDGGGVMAMVLMLPLGFSYSVVNVAGQTVMDDRVPIHLRGRVGATQAAMAALASSLPVLAAGALSDVIGVPPVMALVAGVTGAIAFMNLRQPKETGLSGRGTPA